MVYLTFARKDNGLMLEESESPAVFKLLKITNIHRESAIHKLLLNRTVLVFAQYTTNAEKISNGKQITTEQN